MNQKTLDAVKRLAQNETMQALATSKKPPRPKGGRYAKADKLGEKVHVSMTADERRKLQRFALLRGLPSESAALRFVALERFRADNIE